mgnify:CR=1 FL=1
MLENSRAPHYKVKMKKIIQLECTENEIKREEIKSECKMSTPKDITITNRDLNSGQPVGSFLR